MFSFRRFLALGVGGGVCGFCYLSSTGAVCEQPRGSRSAINQEQILNAPNMTLVSVQVFFRHGARTPLKHITGLRDEVRYDESTLLRSEIPFIVEFLHGGPQPVNPVNADYVKTVFKGGVNAGMLTTTGKEQAYQLGQRLAKRYRHEHKFIASDFSSQEIFVRSTNVQRCIESMQCVVSGLFGVESFADKPLVIRVDKVHDDVLFPRTFNCEFLRTMAKFSDIQFMKSGEFIDLVSKIQAHTGDTRSIEHFESMEIIHSRDHYVARKTHGLVVPEFLEELKDQIDQAAVLALSHHLCCGEVDWKEFVEKNKHVTGLESMDLQRTGILLAMGQLWHLITETMRMAADKSQQSPKLFLYACHDASLVPLLVAMGCYDNEWPPYAADVTFEMYEDSKEQHWVKVSYCGKDIIVSGCAVPMIPLDRFLAIVKDYVIEPEDFKALCGKKL